RFGAGRTFMPALRLYATDACVISTEWDAARAAAPVRAAAPLAVSPRGLILSLGAPPFGFKTLSRAPRFCVNVLRPGQNAAAVAAELNDPISTYDGDWRDGPYDVPYLSAAKANLFCDLIGWAVLEGDALMVGDVFHAVTEARSAPLRFAGAVTV